MEEDDVKRHAFIDKLTGLGWREECPGFYMWSWTKKNFRCTLDWRTDRFIFTRP